MSVHDEAMADLQTIVDKLKALEDPKKRLKAFRSLADASMSALSDDLDRGNYPPKERSKAYAFALDTLFNGMQIYDAHNEGLLFGPID